MTNSTHESPRDNLFRLFPYEDSQFEEDIFALIEQGVLPREVLLNLAAIGHYELDDETGKRKKWIVINDLIENISDPASMRPVTRELLHADAPDAIVDWNQGWNKEARASYEHMYYSVYDLVRVVYADNSHSTKDRDERVRRAVAVAKSLWRTVLVRHHPEWLENPDTHFAPRVSFGNVYDGVTKKTKCARIISHTALSDPLVYSTYHEATTTGIRGIASKGIKSLRLLLSDEHPELL